MMKKHKMDYDPVICWSNIFIVVMAVALLYLFIWAMYKGADILHSYDEKVRVENSLK